MRRDLYVGIILIVLYLIALFIGFKIGVASCKQYYTERDTITFIDTVPYYKPVVRDSIVLKCVTRILPVKKDTSFAINYAQNDSENIPQVIDTPDSAAVEIPITQVHYEGKDYSAYVSGYEPKLDSIFVYPKTTVIRERSNKPPNKIHIGVIGGYGYGFKSKQVEPYIGLGVSYSIISF